MFGLETLIGPVVKTIGDVVGEFIEDPDERNRIMGGIQTRLITQSTTIFAEASKTIRAEAQSDSWLTKSWRPITMMSFVAIIVNNYIIAPYMAWIGYPVPTLAIPPDMWTLLSIGIGGYVVSRGGEKLMDKWKEK